MILQVVAFGWERKENNVINISSPDRLGERVHERSRRPASNIPNAIERQKKSKRGMMPEK